MKIRTQFVSNSSSSSFILVFPFKIEGDCRDKVRKLLFGKEDLLTHHYYEYEQYSTNTVVNKLFDIGFTEIDDLEKLTQEFQSCDSLGIELEDYEHIEDNRLKWNRYHQAQNLVADKKARDFKEKHKDGFIYQITISDNDGELDSFMEHGDIFRRVPHVSINQH